MIKNIYSESINNALEQESRQYLMGHLSKKQLLEYIDGDIEIGISDYKKYTMEEPHYHEVCTEISYILDGCLKMKNLSAPSDDIKEYKKGDFIVIDPGTKYATKALEGTKIFFIKSPGINDKKKIKVADELKEWLENWEK